MKKAMLFTLAGMILVAGMMAVPCAYSQERTDLGMIDIPRDMEFSGQDENGPVTVTIPKGEYRLFVFEIKGNYSIGIHGNGMTYGLDSKVSEKTEVQSEPKAEVKVVNQDGKDFVEIKVLVEKYEVVSLTKCLD
jgi:hypothetical protein